MYKFARWFLYFIVPFFLDRLTKLWVIDGTLQSQVINSCCNFYITSNRGIAWGIGSNMSDGYTLMLHGMVAVILLYFIYFMYQMRHNTMMYVGSMLVLSGGISNFLDRIWYGSVIDFIHLHWGAYYFPVFNVADVSITIGGLLLFIGLLRQQP